jgi:hypothetical protein
MDATLKRRMHRVAVIHFVLTASLVLVFVLQPASSFSGNWAAWLRYEEHHKWREMWDQLLEIIGFGLQPQFLLLYKANDFVTLQNILKSLPSWLLLGVYIFSVPAWSFCFGWIFVKLDNWLNHFPVLGKRVF